MIILIKILLKIFQQNFLNGLIKDGLLLLVKLKGEKTIKEKELIKKKY